MKSEAVRSSAASHSSRRERITTLLPSALLSLARLNPGEAFHFFHQVSKYLLIFRYSDRRQRVDGSLPLLHAPDPFYQLQFYFYTARNTTIGILSRSHN